MSGELFFSRHSIVKLMLTNSLQKFNIVTVCLHKGIDYMVGDHVIINTRRVSKGCMDFLKGTEGSDLNV
jgi:hypothetical protein